MRNYIANNKASIISLFSISIFAVIFLYYNNGISREYRGTIEYPDGVRVYTKIETYNDSDFNFQSYTEYGEGKSVSYNCEGFYELNEDKVTLNIDKMQGGCLDSYEMIKINSSCYVLLHSQIKSRNQAFYVCKQ